MPVMGAYCKAYPIELLREFPGWDAGTTVVADGVRYLFLQENFIVTQDVFLNEQVVFDKVSPEWEKFCRERLHFTAPDLDAPATGSL